MERKILVKNFWRVGNDSDRNLYEDDLGWQEGIKKAAKSDYSRYIFRYCVEEVGLNILLYWTVDRNFYVIETEKYPLEVRRINPNPDWDGECELEKAGSKVGPTTSSDGEILATFNDATEIWDGLSINGVALEDILEKSVIIEMD